MDLRGRDTSSSCTGKPRSRQSRLLRRRITSRAGIRVWELGIRKQGSGNVKRGDNAEQDGATGGGSAARDGLRSLLFAGAWAESVLRVSETGDASGSAAIDPEENRR